MRLQRSVLVTAALSAVLAFAVGCGGGKLTLRLDPEVGVPYEFTTFMETTSEQTVMGQEVTATQSMRMVQEMIFERLEDDAGFRVVITLGATSLGMDAAAGGNAVSLPGQGSVLMDDIATAMIGRSFAMTMSHRGKVTGVSGLVEMMDEVFEEFAPEGPLREMTRETLGQQFGEEAAQKMMTHAFLSYPQDGLSVGESWDVGVSMMGMRTESTTTLAALGDGIATFASTATTRPAAESGSEAGAMGITYETLDGTQTGTYRIDAESGMLLDADLTAHMQATIRLSIPGLSDEMAAKMGAMPMVSSSTIRVEARKLE
jgi:hypothetical protein